MIDGCPRCVKNTEPPRSIVPVKGGSMAAYHCSDCGHAWTTDWAETPYGACVLSTFDGGDRGTIGAQIKTAPGTRSANCESWSQGLASTTEER